MYLLIRIIFIAIDIYEFLIVINALLSWFPQAYNSTIGSLINQIVEPALSVIQRVVPAFFGLDFSPAILIFILELIRRLIDRLIY